MYDLLKKWDLAEPLEDYKQNKSFLYYFDRVLTCLCTKFCVIFLNDQDITDNWIFKTCHIQRKHPQKYISFETEKIEMCNNDVDWTNSFS